MSEARKECERKYYQAFIARQKAYNAKLKSYDEIKAYNRKHPIPAGWRGQSPFWGYFNG